MLYTWILEYGNYGMPWHSFFIWIAVHMNDCSYDMKDNRLLLIYELFVNKKISYWQGALSCAIVRTVSRQGALTCARYLVDQIQLFLIDGIPQNKKMSIAQALKAKTKTMRGRKHVITKSKSRPEKPLETILRKLNTSSAQSLCGNFKPWFETQWKEVKSF